MLKCSNVSASKNNRIRPYTVINFGIYNSASNAKQFIY